jgi:hypothetical protein
MITKKTAASERFCVFLLLLKEYIKRVLRLITPNVIVTLDNTPIHVSEVTKEASEELNLRMRYLVFSHACPFGANV